MTGDTKNLKYTLIVLTILLLVMICFNARQFFELQACAWRP